MPALPNVSKVLRVDLLQTIGANTRVKNRIYFSYTGVGPTTADLNTLASTISSAWVSGMIARQNTGCILTGINITDLTSPSAAQVATSQSRTGTLAGTPLSAGVAMIVKLKIARRYRGGHPRYYHAGRVVSDLATSTTWSATQTADLVVGFNAFIAACVASPPTNLGTLAQVNVGYFQGFTNRTFPSGRTHSVPNLRGTPVVDPVVSVSVNNGVGSQRRRNQQSA